MLLKRVGRSNGSRLLPQGSKNTTNDFRLPVEIHQSLFDETREFQIAIKVEMLFRFERRFSRAAQRFAVLRFARRVFGADAHLKTRTSVTPATTFIWR